ncbi:prepilin-type N-terminal cleavage/methylation domain-containing protein [Pokkaliibacter sp. MBI-7]|uniref:prepilin-type N-terminal cleavage/methylation domain-containing protein n=1 Tax=Pokkaliibacter sp. MBI-7 TaxID=3040600 RepID=UPI002449A6BC|nr:prepilin-type N-terminal cleavage/methylation domain-containing protein [Pokkaliibacter sp. MBI-7]MDH2431072.1 prepilin-type N-terminal cleavage/methylation domain-containing protein [Pokkaliibacter sp. MBI-7]
MSAVCLPRQQRGFTLLELLFALVLLALLLLLAWQAISRVQRVAQQVEQLNQRQDDIRTAQNYLRQALMNALAQTAHTDDNGHRQVFVGAPDSVLFVAAMPNQFAGLGPLVQQLSLQEQRLQISLHTLPAEPGATPSPSWQEQHTLLEGIRQWQLQYLGWNENGEASAWQSSWQWSNRLPLAVRIHITLADGTLWPTLTIPIRRNVSGYW